MSPVLPAAGTIPVHTISAENGWVPIRPRELWAYRDLLYFLIWREIKVRYKQTALGVAWAVLQPLLAMVVFSVVFGRLANLPSDGVPYPGYSFCALLPWQLFAFAVTQASNSVVTNQSLVTKVYFPRLIMPFASVGVGLIDFAVSFVVLAGLMLAYGISPTAAIVTIPLWIAIAVLTALGVGLWLAALNVHYRDIRYTLPFVTQIWLYATPVAYSSQLVPEKWRGLYALNPMVGVVDGFRWAMLGSGPSPWQTAAVSSTVVLVLLISGLYYFRRTERTFADVL